MPDCDHPQIAGWSRVEEERLKDQNEDLGLHQVKHLDQSHGNLENRRERLVVQPGDQQHGESCVLPNILL